MQLSIQVIACEKPQKRHWWTGVRGPPAKRRHTSRKVPRYYFLVIRKMPNAQHCERRGSTVPAKIDILKRGYRASNIQVDFLQSLV